MAQALLGLPYPSSALDLCHLPPGVVIRLNWGETAHVPLAFSSPVETGICIWGGLGLRVSCDYLRVHQYSSVMGWQELLIYPIQVPSMSLSRGLDPLGLPTCHVLERYSKYII